MGKLKKPDTPENKGKRVKDCKADQPVSSIIAITVGFNPRIGEMCWVKPHTDSEEGKAFLRVCLKKIMKKRPFNHLLSLSNKGEKR